jgi:ribonuclease-3
MADKMSEKDMKTLMDMLGHSFGREILLVEALTHSSWSNEHPEDTCNERLEFMGDAVLGFITAGELFRRFPDWDEGMLTAAKAHLVGKDHLQEIAQAMGLTAWLRVGTGERRSDGVYPPSMGVNALEALIGAVFLDGGVEAARRMVLSLLQEPVDRIEREGVPEDPKSRLQALALKMYGKLPVYRIVGQSGPDHDKIFRCSVTTANGAEAFGLGPSKKEAQKEAARSLIRLLEG